MTNKSSHFGSGRPHKQWGVLGERSKREKRTKLTTQHHEALSLASSRSAEAAGEKKLTFLSLHYLKWLTHLQTQNPLNPAMCVMLNPTK